MNKTIPRWSLFLTLFVLYLLHNDLWFWNDASLVMGVPIGLLYHIGYCAAASIMLIVLVKYAWPHQLEAENKEEKKS